MNAPSDFTVTLVASIVVYERAFLLLHWCVVLIERPTESVIIANRHGDVIAAMSHKTPARMQGGMDAILAKRM